MKSRVWDRMILFIGALLCIGAGAWTAADGILWVLDAASTTATWVRIVKIVLGVLAVLAGLYLLAFPRKYVNRKKDFVVQNTDAGELRIAVRAIENLVQKCIDMHDEIQVESVKIRNGRQGVTVDMSIALANNIAIPLAVSSLQKQIKQYLVASSGIEVVEVRVSVETTQPGVEMNESPYLVDSQETNGEPAHEENRKEDKKVPLHQRLFRRGDEAVTVPEPPVKEPEAQESAGETEDQTESAPPQEEAQEAQTAKEREEDHPDE